MRDAPKEQSEAVLEARRKAAELAAAFLLVFGAGQRRSKEQKLVLDHLALCAGEDGNPYRAPDSRDGIRVLIDGIHQHGAQTSLRIIERQLSIATQKTAKAAKPIVKR